MNQEYNFLLELIMEERGWIKDLSKLSYETLTELSESRNEDYPFKLLKKTYKEMGWDITEEEIRILIL